MALAELEAQAMRARVQAAADVARIALDTLRELGLCVSDHDLLLAKNTITIIMLVGLEQAQQRGGRR